MPRLKRSEIARYREVVEAYKQATSATAVDIRDVVRWALDKHHLNGDWDPMAWHMGRCAEALRHVSGPSRDWYCASREVVNAETQEPEQRMLWGHKDDAPEDLIEDDIKQRLRDVQRDFAAVKRDVDDIARSRPVLGVRLRQNLIDFNLV